MKTLTRFFGDNGAEQPPYDASAAVRETFFDDGRLMKREVIKANRTTLANAQRWQRITPAQSRQNADA